MKILLIFLLNFKFISLVPSVTEIFYLLEAQDSLIAISYYCNYPDDTKNKLKVGDLLNPNYEKILELNPDFVIISLPMQKQVETNLKKLKVQYINFNPETIDGILATIDSIGKLTNKTERSNFVIDSLKHELGKLVKFDKVPKVYVELSSNPIYSIGKNSFLNEVVKKAGGANIFEDMEQPYFVPNQEEIIKKNPECILLIYPEANKKSVEKRMGWGEIKAIKNNKIYVLDPDLFTRPGPRIFSAILKLNRLLQSCF